MSYMLFSGYAYYPQGGFDDFKGAFETIEECEAAFKNLTYDNEWGQIVSTESMEIKKEFYGTKCWKDYHDPRRTQIHD